MKRFVLFVGILFVAGMLWGQTVDIDEVDPTQLDMTEVDLSGAELFFNGPLQLYVTGLRYEGMSYAAILNYDGASTITIEAPEVATTRGKPQAIDLADIQLALTEEGIRLSQLVADGRLYSGLMTPQADNDLSIASISAGDRAPGNESALRNRIGELEESIEQKDQRIARLNEQIDDLPEPERVRRLRDQTRVLEDELEAARDRVSSLETQVRERERQVESLRSRVSDLRDPWITANDRLTRVLLSGFAEGTPALGTWNVSRGTLAQTNDSSLFAKYMLAANQPSRDIMYSLSGRATGEGWNGYGLHFLASDSQSARGYGYGTSYLVWMNHDPRVDRESRTYAQLYRSYGDADMVLLASVPVDLDIAATADIDVYVDRSESSLTVLVNGDDVLSVVDDSLIRTGRSVAVRTLGSARITDLRVITE